MKKVIITFGMIFLSTLSSCSSPSDVVSLRGKVYVNKKTGDKIEFTNNAKIIFTWSGYQSNLGIFQRNQPYEFKYIYENKVITPYCLTSAQALSFPFKRMELSESQDKIIANQNYVFERVN
jgi:hypothetical protein